MLVTQCTRSGQDAMPPLSPASRLMQGQIEFATIEVAPQVNALVGADVEPQARAGSRTARQQFGQTVGGEILGDSEPHHAFIGGSCQHVAGFFGERQQSPRVRQ